MPRSRRCQYGGTGAISSGIGGCFRHAGWASPHRRRYHRLTTAAAILRISVPLHRVPESNHIARISYRPSLTRVHHLFSSPLLMWSTSESLVFSVKLALRKGLRLVRGMRRALTDDEWAKIAEAIVNDLELNNWKFEQGPAPGAHSQIMGEPSDAEIQ
jgi:hypothetical protein